MKILALNGSPRKDWNTATLLGSVLEGARSQGADARLIHLYDLTYKGCRSCFACKVKGGRSYGKCAPVDDLSPILQQIETADAIVLGSPIYYGEVTGEMRSFLERLLFPYSSYSAAPKPLFPKTLPCAFVYTMNVDEKRAEELGYVQSLSRTEAAIQRILGPVKTLYSYDTLQFDDYSRVVADRFDPEKKAQRRAEVFPGDCRKAFDIGLSFASSLLV